MKNQKGFTTVELIYAIICLCIFAGAVFFGCAAVYAVGKYLFGWWG